MIKCNAIDENMVKVRALATYKENSIQDNVLGFVPEPGYEFEVTEERLEVLSGKNGHNLKFVEVIEEPKKEVKEVKKVVKKKKTK